VTRRDDWRGHKVVINDVFVVVLIGVIRSRLVLVGKPCMNLAHTQLIFEADIVVNLLL